MIGLDANVLVRYLTQDGPVQSPKATAFIERTLSPENPGFISVVAIAEIVWVLQRVYAFGRDRLVEAIERILQADAFASGLGSFSDALIEALGFAAGCSYTVTFDQKALRIAGFRRL
jgi:predicted nucleic-acid-binding protein